MCGIAGFCANPNDPYFSERGMGLAPFLASELLYQSSARGTDACGWSWIDESVGKIRTWKRNVSPGTVLDKYYHRFPEYTPAMILHTRFATQGTAKNPDNNHPIKHGRVVGVHNGMICNDDHLFRKFHLNRRAEVDSEAIFAMLGRGKDKSATLSDTLEEIEGSMAIAWMDRVRSMPQIPGGPATIYLARGHQSPLWVGQNQAGSLVFASTREILVDACEDSAFILHWVQEIAQGSILKVSGGVIKEWGVFKPLAGFTWTQGGTNRGTRGWTEPIAIGSTATTRPYDDSFYDSHWDRMAEESLSYPSEVGARQVQDADWWESQRAKDAADLALEDWERFQNAMAREH